MGFGGIDIFTDTELDRINRVSENKIINDDMRTYVVHCVRFCDYKREGNDKEIAFFAEENHAINAVVELNNLEIDYNSKNGPGYFYYYRERIIDQDNIRKSKCL